ncbi:histone deacetylase [Streptomyces platensis]|uniref:histone deacetylase n=1 Tax=Streptomyces platensis TaxID=58346 RepID=UPI002252F9F1|nr:histone deacetylase [Streptomyces platensis]MCX4638488.1 histone deacetylase [Streptomyces platensis]
MIRPRRLEALDDSPAAVRHRTPVRRLWYAAYGSNMHLDRLTAYLAGGRPAGGLRSYPGCRDPRGPARTAPVMLPGLLYFATESDVWTGGRAFYDPDGGPARDGLPGSAELPSRAYLLTLSQFSDIAAQEMGQEPGEDLDLTEAVTRGRARIGPGRYETLVCTGLLDGDPVVTFTAPWSSQDITMNAPSAAYLRHIAAGLVDSHGWSARQAAAYLAGCPGADGHWTATEIAALLTDPS